MLHDKNLIHKNILVWHFQTMGYLQFFFSVKQLAPESDFFPPSLLSRITHAVMMRILVLHICFLKAVEGCCKFTLILVDIFREVKSSVLWSTVWFNVEGLQPHVGPVLIHFPSCCRQLQFIHFWILTSSCVHPALSELTITCPHNCRWPPASFQPRVESHREGLGGGQVLQRQTSLPVGLNILRLYPQKQLSDFRASWQIPILSGRDDIEHGLKWVEGLQDQGGSACRAWTCRDTTGCPWASCPVGAERTAEGPTVAAGVVLQLGLVWYRPWKGGDFNFPKV